MHLSESVDHTGTVADMRQYSQFQLTVVGHDEGLPGLSHESVPNLVLVFLQSRLVLQIRAAGGQSTSLRVQIEGAVDAVVLIY